MSTLTKHVKQGQTFTITYSTGEFKGGTATFIMEAKRQARLLSATAPALPNLQPGQLYKVRPRAFVTIHELQTAAVWA